MRSVPTTFVLMTRAVRISLDFGGETIDTMLAIPGVQSVPNAVKAAAVAYRLGVTPEQIDAAFRGLTITGHRQEIKRAKSGARVIDDSYCCQCRIHGCWPRSAVLAFVHGVSYGDPGRDGRDGR